MIARSSPVLISLAFERHQSNRCCHAVITAQGDYMIANTVQTESMSEPKATKKAAAGARRADVAPAKAKAGKKANLKKKAPRSAQNEAREGSKTATVLELLKRPGGASAKELLKATGWQPHSLRGFLSGTVGKKMGLAVTSAKEEDGERHYSIKPDPFGCCSCAAGFAPGGVSCLVMRFQPAIDMAPLIPDRPRTP
jgi:hypothetical protein